MRSLVPCPSCWRHVESNETACPFCEAALVPSLAKQMNLRFAISPTGRVGDAVVVRPALPPSGEVLDHGQPVCQE
jgi:hypothetical protein